jgi:hypothetical protein
MSLEDSPSLEEFKHGQPERLPDPGRAKRKIRATILGLVVLVLVLGGINILNSPLGQSIKGMGRVEGRVIDEKSQPAKADVLILGTTILVQTDPNGRFSLSEVPAGMQSLVITYQGQGVEERIEINAGQTTILSDIKIEATAQPLP